MLMPLSFAPFDVWPSGIASIALLLIAIHEGTIKHVVLCHYVFAVALFAVGTSWLYVSIYTFGGASIGLAVILVMLFVIFCQRERSTYI